MQWESLKVNESKIVEPELVDEDRQARFWMRMISADRTGSQSMKKDLKKLFKDTQWTVEQLSLVAGHKSVSASVWHDLLLKFGISKEDRV